MNLNLNDTKEMLNCLLDSNLNITGSQSTIGCWDYWRTHYYPTYHYSYPVYIKERAKDKGKQAYEIIKILKDKKLVKLEKVSDFIDLMDELIKIL